MPASLNIQPAKRGDARGLAAHAYRFGSVEDHVDHDRTYLNKVLFGPSTFQEAKAEIDALPSKQPNGRKIRSDANYTAQLVCTFPEELDEDKLNAWAASTVQWASKDAPGQLLYAVMHRDEGRPHIHLGIAALEEESGKLNYKALFGRDHKDDPGYRLMAMQETYAEAIESMGVAPTEGKEYSRETSGMDGWRVLKAIAEAKAEARAEIKAELQPVIDQAALDKTQAETAETRAGAAKAVLTEVTKRAESAEAVLTEVAEVVGLTKAIQAPEPVRLKEMPENKPVLRDKNLERMRRQARIPRPANQVVLRPTVTADPLPALPAGPSIADILRDWMQQEETKRLAVEKLANLEKTLREKVEKTLKNTITRAETAETAVQTWKTRHQSLLETCIGFTKALARANQMFVGLWEKEYRNTEGQLNSPWTEDLVNKIVGVINEWVGFAQKPTSYNKTQDKQKQSLVSETYEIDGP